MAQCLLTTFDNPINPFTDRDQWLEFDNSHGYHTDQLLAAFNEASSMMEDDEYEYETNLAIDHLLTINPSGMHYKLYEDNAAEVIAIINKAYNDSLKHA